MLSDPVHLDPRSLNPHPPPPPPALQKLVEPRSPVDVLASPCTSVSHPAPISKCLVLLNLCLMCSAQALCVCHIHSVDTSLCSPPISPSHICIVSLCDLDLPPSPLYFPCYKKTGTCQISSPPLLLKAPNPHFTDQKMSVPLVKCWLLFLILDWLWTSMEQLIWDAKRDEIHLMKWTIVLLLDLNREHLQRFHHLS